MTTPTPSIVWLANGAVVEVSADNYTIIVNASSEGIYQCLVEASFNVSTNEVGLPPISSFISTTFVDILCESYKILITYVHVCMPCNLIWELSFTYTHV